MRRARPGPWQFSRRFSNRASSSRTWGTVSAGVRIFSPPGLLRQEPGGQQRKRLVVVPALPGPHLVVGQARLALGTLEALLHPVLRLEHPRELVLGLGPHHVGQQVVVLA